MSSGRDGPRLSDRSGVITAMKAGQTGRHHTHRTDNTIKNRAAIHPKPQPVDQASAGAGS